MMNLNWPAFVLQRRINIPLQEVERALCDPRWLRADIGLDPDTATILRLEKFRLTFPPFGLDMTSWRALGSVRTRRGRSIESVELEINAWDRTATELLVRPRARRLPHWGGRRVDRYFRSAHTVADVVAQRINAYDAAPALRAPDALTRAG